MSSLPEALSSLLSFLIFDDVVDDDFDLALYSAQTGVPLEVVQRDLDRLRKRGCLTPDFAISWATMRQADLRSVLEWVHNSHARELSLLISMWAGSNPGKFSGWVAETTFEADPCLHGRRQ